MRNEAKETVTLEGRGVGVWLGEVSGLKINTDLFRKGKT